MNRRLFVSTLTLAAAASAVNLRRVLAQSTAGPRQRMTLCLAPGSIGVRANQTESIELAQRHGFTSVEPFPSELAALAPAQTEALLEHLKSRSLVWGAAGLPIDFRGDETRFAAGLRDLPGVAKALQRVGVVRVGTWISPGHSTLTYMQNLQHHATRLRAVAQVLKDHGQRLGLEYVGTKTSRDPVRFPFLHTLAELQDLMAEIGTGNVGVVLDSWHWWQAGDSVADLAKLRNEDVVSVDLNDAPRGLAKDQQLDNQRELPAATGVIPVAAFLDALRRIEYDGPVRAEPFNRVVNEMDNDAACAATITALKKAMELAG
jgi:sugar phosphate isomerase/epimerase